MPKHSQSTYGLIGNPLTHSLSPLMHNTAFKTLGVDATYELFPLKEDELKEFFSNLHKKDSPIFGLNVTVPYKEKVIQYLDALSPFVQKAMAVNTIAITEDRKLTGFNTDGPGFLCHLTELKFDIKGKRMVILGAGGATRAIVAAICVLPLSEKPSSIKLYDIEIDKAEFLIKDLSSRLDGQIVQVVQSIDDLDIERADCFINATPVGLKKTDPCPVNEEFLHAHMFVYDLIYNLPETKLLKAAKEKGAMASNGLGMLYYQGILAFQHWASIELDEEIKSKMRASLTKGVPRA